MNLRHALLTVAGLLLAAAVAYNAYVSSVNAATVSQVCAVQARGLEARPYLVAAMEALSKLATPMTTGPIPQSEVRRYVLAQTLRNNLDHYVEIQSHQPKHSCGG